MPQSPTLPPDSSFGLWSEPEMSALLAARDMGAVFRLYRRATKISQTELARSLGGAWDQSRISALERGDYRVEKLTSYEQIVRGLGVPWHLLALAGLGREAAGDDEPDKAQDEVVRRRHFLGFAATAALPAVLTAHGQPRIGTDDVRRFATELDDFVRLDDRFGGDAVYLLASAAVGQLRHVRETASYPPEVGQHLDRLVGRACHHAGWLAFDTGRQQAARSWWLEALHAADLADDRQSPTLVFASMSMQARDVGHGREAVRLAQRALKESASLPRSRRLRSLLLAREADGHVTSDPKLAAKTYARIENSVTVPPEDDDPAWIGFWGHADFAAGRALTAQRAGDLPEAVSAAREAAAATDPVRFSRNHTSYMSILGSALVAHGDLDEGLPVLGRAILQADTLGSVRVRDRIRGSLGILAASSDAKAREFCEWANSRPTTA